MKKNFSRVITTIITLALIITTSSTAMAATGTEQIQALLGREIIVTYNGIKQTFTDVNGVQVHPIAYQGTTYLPVRAVSKMFNYDIQWLGEKNTVSINNGNYSGDNFIDITKATVTKNETIPVTLSFDLTVTYTDVVQSFFDINGKQVYPITNNGTTYLPIRAVSNMFGETIEWIGSENRVSIGTGTYTPEPPVVETPKPDPTPAVTLFNGYTVNGTSENVSFVDSISETDIFVGTVMKIEVSKLEDNTADRVKFSYEDYKIRGQVFTLYNYGKSEVHVVVQYQGMTNEFYNSYIIQPGESRECEAIVRGSKWFSFGISFNQSSDTKLAVGNFPQW